VGRGKGLGGGGAKGCVIVHLKPTLQGRPSSGTPAHQKRAWSEGKRRSRRNSYQIINSGNNPLVSEKEAPVFLHVRASAECSLSSQLTGRGYHTKDWRSTDLLLRSRRKNIDFQLEETVILGNL